MSGLPTRIKPGDAVDATVVDNEFSALETLVESIEDRQLRSGAIDTRHLVGDWIYPYVESFAGPIAGPAVYTALLPVAPTNYTLEVGQPYLIIGSTDVTSTATPGSGAILISIDGVPVASTNRVAEISRNGQHRGLHTVYVAVATAATHQIDLLGLGPNCTFNYSHLQIIGIRR